MSKLDPPPHEEHRSIDRTPAHGADDKTAYARPDNMVQVFTCGRLSPTDEDEDVNACSVAIGFGWRELSKTGEAG